MGRTALIARLMGWAHIGAVCAALMMAAHIRATPAPLTAERLLARTSALMEQQGFQATASAVKAPVSVLPHHLVFQTAGCTEQTWIVASDPATHAKLYFSSVVGAEFYFSYHYDGVVSDFPNGLTRRLHHLWRQVAAGLGLRETPAQVYLMVAQPRACAARSIDLSVAFHSSFGY